MAGFRRGKRTWEERHSRKRSPVGTALGLNSRLALGRLAPPGARRRQLQTGTTRRAFPLRARRSLITAAPPSRGDPVASGRRGAAPSPRPAVPPRAAAAGNRARERVGHGGTCPAAAKWPPPRVCPPAAGGAARSAGGGRRGAAMERRAASEEEAAPAGECSQKCYDIFVLETVCVAWFSFEFLLRSIQAENKCAFLKTPLNIIDILAILPFYISLIVDMASTKNSSKPGGGAGNKYLERVGLVLRFLRALRILYVMRLARHSLGLQTLGLTVRRCTREFGLLLLFLCVAMALFSPLVYLAESELGAKQEFTSIPTSYWWAVISMTTVGYGDMVPRSIPGQVVALSSILSGILLMAFPVTSIFHTFSRSYSELKEQQQRAASRQMHQLEESTKLAGGGSSQWITAASPPDAAREDGRPELDQEAKRSC
ncbi:potassium voltage-gated channel subfamily G member 2 isoform X2 [Gallus gallus]|uniref:potassium voltage-gated channel subfamily G member 2 isoform X2 n=1 Tax=Gallus gallus TaxID=9031 RepID=UPI001F016EE8|nr:potassium voltage-gated channel subfamily G member 2 isoform X2 [Gallus gallus]